MSAEQLAATAASIAERLRAAERQCRAEYVNPRRVPPGLPAVRELAETVAALAALIAELSGTTDATAGDCKRPCGAPGCESWGCLQ